MVELQNISKIGFGAYRISINSKEHYKALYAAIERGCNLIDTAATYSRGESEQLIGKIASELKRSQLFIITKAGYIQGEDMKNVQNLRLKNVSTMGKNSSYSLDVEYLDYQITKSLSRLQTKFIDGFLLHNPEHYFNSLESVFEKDKVYHHIRKAFEYLEQMVHDNKIRYYGVSSNTLPFSSQKDDTLSLDVLASVANSTAENNHFKLVQFPFNIIEDAGIKEDHIDGDSLVTLCKKLGYLTFTNRPLNAAIDNGAVRLATYNEELIDSREYLTHSAFDAIFETILAKLKIHGMDDQWKEFPILAHLHENWKEIGNPEAVDKLLKDHFDPFLDSLFDGNIPDKFNSLYLSFYQSMIAFSKSKITEEAKKIEKDLLERGVIAKGESSFSYRLCQYYLSQGINHVLVGMRKERYVSDMMGGFGSVK